MKADQSLPGKELHDRCFSGDDAPADHATDSQNVAGKMSLITSETRFVKVNGILSRQRIIRDGRCTNEAALEGSRSAMATPCFQPGGAVVPVVQDCTLLRSETRMAATGYTGPNLRDVVLLQSGDDSIFRTEKRQDSVDSGPRYQLP